MSRNLLINIGEWLATFLAFAGTASILLQLGKRSRIFQMATLLICLVLPVVPIMGLNISQYFLTIVGHLSITSMSLLAVLLLRHLVGKTILISNERTIALVGIAISSLLLYLAAFGLVNFDLYQAGYGSVSFILVLFLFAITAALLDWNITLVALVAAAAAFQMHFLASNNLWDYLIDPLLAIVAFMGLSRSAFVYVTARRTATPVQAVGTQ